MKLSLFKAALLVTVILTTTAYAQEQGLTFNFFGGGARSEGMGQAFLAISNDGSAGGWNPAGLNVHEKTLMAFSYGFLMPRGKYTFYESPTLSRAYAHTGDYGAINDLSIISPIRIKNHHVVLNLSYTRNFDAYYKFAEHLTVPYIYLRTGGGGFIYLPFLLGANDTLPNTQLERRGGINSINFAFGSRLYKNLSMGMSANIYTGTVVTMEHRNLGMDFTYDGVTYSAHNGTDLIDSTKYSGFNATFGLLYEVEKLRLGLVLRTPFNLVGESDTSLYRITTLNKVADANYTDTVYIDNMSSKTEVPLMIGVGFGYNANENLLLAGDLEFRNFSNKVIKNLDSILLTAGGERLEFYHNTDPHWSNVIQARIGAEYLLHSSIGIIPIRAGLRNEAFPFGNISDYSIIYQGEKGTAGNDSSRVSYAFQYNTDKVTGLSFAIGTGIQWSQVILDVAYTYTTYEQKIYKDSVLRAKNKWNNHHLNFTFTGYF